MEQRAISAAVGGGGLRKRWLATVEVVVVGKEGMGFAGYLSVERGGVGESGWEGRRQLRRVQRV